MIVLDTYALVAAAAGEPAAEEVAQLLRKDRCVVTTTTVAELYDQLARRAGLSPESIDAHVQPLLEEALVLRELDVRRAAQAGLLRAQLYRPRTAELSLADCVLLASLDEGDSLATSDLPLARAARRLGYGVSALPDSSGRRP